MKELDGRVAFVTGGSSGIGLGLVEALARENMRIAFTYRRKDHLSDAMAHLGKAGLAKHLLPLELDVADRSAFARAADDVERTLDRFSSS